MCLIIIDIQLIIILAAAAVAIFTAVLSINPVNKFINKLLTNSEEEE